MGVTQHRLAVSIGVPLRQFNQIVRGNRRITANTALRLSRYFGSPGAQTKGAWRG